MNIITIEVEDQVARSFEDSSSESKARLNKMINLLLKASSITETKSKNYIDF